MTREELKKLHVAVVSGGWSDEHEIAMESGKQCAAALKEAGFTSVDLLDVAEKDFVVTLAQGGYDVVYVAMHGRFGEDGCIQGLLEILHIPYTFSGVLASAMGTEKSCRSSCIGRQVFQLLRELTLPQVPSLQMNR